MGTLHAILDEPAAARAAEQEEQEAAASGHEDSPPSTAGGSGATAPGSVAPLGSLPGSQTTGVNAEERPSSPRGGWGSGGGGGGRSGGNNGGLMNVKKIVTISQNRKKNRGHFMRADVLDRILAVSGRMGNKDNGSRIHISWPW